MAAIGEDDRDPDTVRFDLLVDQVNALVGKMDAVIERGGNTQTVVHKTAGMGPWGAAAVTACFCTMLGLILLSFELQRQNDDLRDLKAWQQIHEKRIGRIEAERK